MLIMIGESPRLAGDAALLLAGLETMDTPALLLDAEQSITYVTPAAERLIGLRTGQVMGRDWAEVWESVCVGGLKLTSEAQRAVLRRDGHVTPVKAWQRAI